MKQSRLVIAALVLVALVVLSTRTTSSFAAAQSPVPCTTSALVRASSGQLSLTSIQQFGCEGQWAYVWATAGRGEMAIGVTEVLHFDTTTQRWLFVSRAADCKASILPSVIYRQGCFSN